MKKLFYALMALVLLYSCNKEPQYKITGKVEGLTKGTAYLQKIEQRTPVNVDSVEFTNGKFVFKGMVTEPDLYFIKVADTLGAIPLLLENTDITINTTADSIYGSKYTGTESTVKYIKFDLGIADFEMKFNKLYNEYMQANMSGDAEKVKEIETQYEAIEKEQMDYIKGFVKDNSKLFVAPIVTVQYLINTLEPNELEEIAAGFDTTYNHSKYVVMINDRVTTMKRVAIGQPYVDFTLNDTTGNPVALSSVVGEKYVLIDFWAAWCSPCRHENPTLVENYAKYKNKGFEIFGVSFDKSRDAWIKAIHDDKITWPQVSDLKYWECEAGKLYGVRGIPHNVLLDKNGIIIAKNLRGEELGAKLAEIFK